MDALRVEKLSGSVGAEVVGVDSERLGHDDALPDAILEALEEVGVLVFRELHLDPETQVAFCRKLGAVETNLTASHDVGGRLPRHARPIEDCHGRLLRRKLRLAHRWLHAQH